MKTKIFTVIIFAVSLQACNKSKPDSNDVNGSTTVITPKVEQVAGAGADSLLNLESYLAPAITDTSKCQVINFDCAVVIYPTKEQIAKMKNEKGEDFYTIADDATFYQSNALGILDSVKVKTIGAVKPFICFKGDSGSWTLDVRKKGLPEWNMIFFSKNRQPKIISEVNLTVEEASDYFDK